VAGEAEPRELLETIGNTASEFLVSEASFATGYGELDGRAMKVGPEWIRVAYRDGNRRNLFHVLERGVFGTPAVAHGAGAPVYYGRVFEFTIHCPSFRDDNNKDRRGPARTGPDRREGGRGGAGAPSAASVRAVPWYNRESP